MIRAAVAVRGGLSAAGDYVPFSAAAAEALRTVSGYQVSDANVEHVLAGFVDLPAHPDSEPAMRLVADAGVRMVCLTNVTSADLVDVAYGLLALPKR